MATERYAIAGLATPRAPWFSRVAQWATTAVLPIDFVKCVSAEEIRMRIHAGQRFSAVLIDAQLSSLDREFTQFLQDNKCAVVVVETTIRVTSSFAITASLPAEFERSDLAAVIAQHCVPSHSFTTVVDMLSMDEAVVQHEGATVAVTGVNGSGVSTVATALSQALAQMPEYAGNVVLVDGKHHSELAMLHDTRDVIPSIQELAETCRVALPSHEVTRQHTFYVDSRGYHVLLGMRQPYAWTALRPQLVRLTYSALVNTFAITVSDVAAEFEGEAESGSIDIEEHNAISRIAVTQATVVLAVGRCDSKGLFALSRVVRSLIAFGVSADNIVVVVLGASKSPIARIQIIQTLSELTEIDAESLHPVFIPIRKNVDSIHRDVALFPSKLTAPLLSEIAPRLADKASAAIDITETAEPTQVVEEVTA